MSNLNPLPAPTFHTPTMPLSHTELGASLSIAIVCHIDGNLHTMPNEITRINYRSHP